MNVAIKLRNSGLEQDADDSLRDRALDAVRNAHAPESWQRLLLEVVTMETAWQTDCSSYLSPQVGSGLRGNGANGRRDQGAYWGDDYGSRALPQLSFINGIQILVRSEDLEDADQILRADANGTV